MKKKNTVGQVTRHRVREAIQAMIVSGRQPVGSKLAQKALAKQFNVAQSVVREALLELLPLGLVEAIDNRGMFVSELTVERLLESYDVREVHEGLVARLCCERITRAQVRELVDMAEESYRQSREKKFDEMAALDAKLHRRLLEIAGHRILLRMADMCLIFGKIINVSRPPMAVRDEHLGVLTAIGQGQTGEAERLMRQHISNGKKAIQEQVAQGKFVLKWVVPRTMSH